jgi:DNA-binding FrmR family transcriptional regulator
MKRPSHPEIVRRLKRAHRHLASILTMFEEGRPCTDLAQQLHAVESAVTSAKREVIHDNIEHCLNGSEGDIKTAMRTFNRSPRPRTSHGPKSRFVRNFDRDV